MFINLAYTMLTDALASYIGSSAHMTIISSDRQVLNFNILLLKNVKENVL